MELPRREHQDFQLFDAYIHRIAVGLKQRMALCLFEVGGDHLATHLLDGDLGRPPQFLFRPARVAEERLDFRRAEVTWIDANDGVADFQGRRLIARDSSDDRHLVDVAAFEAQRDAELFG